MNFTIKTCQTVAGLSYDQLIFQIFFKFNFCYLAQLWSCLGVRLGRNVAYSKAFKTKIRLICDIPADRTGDCRYAQKTNLIHSVYQVLFPTVIWAYWQLPVILIDLTRTSILDYLRIKLAWLISRYLFSELGPNFYHPEIISLNISFPLPCVDFCEK